jgi:hypothetical protein
MKFITFLFLLCLSSVSMAYGQDTAQTKKERAFVVPPEHVLPAVVSQPDCPLKFENVKVLYYLDGGMADSFELRNRGTKPIRDYTVAWYSSYGNASVMKKPIKEAGTLILPGALAPQDGVEGDVEIVPIPDQFNKKFKLKDRPMDGVVMFMVVRVEFADGTTYNNEAASSALREYFESVSDKLAQIKK